MKPFHEPNSTLSLPYLLLSYKINCFCYLKLVLNVFDYFHFRRRVNQIHFLTIKDLSLVILVLIKLCLHNQNTNE